MQYALAEIMIDQFNALKLLPSTLSCDAHLLIRFFFGLLDLHMRNRKFRKQEWNRWVEDKRQETPFQCNVNTYAQPPKEDW